SASPGTATTSGAALSRPRLAGCAPRGSPRAWWHRVLMPAPILRTDRLLLVPLDDRHLELEVRLDSDPEVMRFITGRGRSREQVLESHAGRMALGSQVDGLGFWMAFGSAAGASLGTTPPAAEEDGEFVGLMMLPPAHGPDQPDDPTVSDLGYRIVRRFWRMGVASEGSRPPLPHAVETVGQSPGTA